MLIDLYPRAHARFTSLPLLGPHMEGFARWLAGRDYPRTLIRVRMRKTPVLEALLLRFGCVKLSEITESQLRGLAPRDSQDDICLSALVRALTDYLKECGTLSAPEATPSERLMRFYREFLAEVRGFADSTGAYHCAIATELLSFLRYDTTPAALRELDAQRDRGVPEIDRETVEPGIASARCGAPAFVPTFPSGPRRGRHRAGRSS